MTLAWQNSRLGVLVAMVLLCAGANAEPARAQWTQWGGPNRDFIADSGKLADTWPEGGPKKLWHRALGEGYSSILADDGVLYTMYVADGAEYTVALEAKTGKTIWKHKNPAPFKGTDYGPGPHSTPLISGQRIFTVGANAMMHCFDKSSGKVLWQHDLAGEFGAPVPYFGYSPSPIAYGNTIIVPVDRKRPPAHGGAPQGEAAKTDAEEKPPAQSLIAFDQADGKVIWKSQDYPIDYSSPILINFDGQDQLVLFMRKEIIGVDPVSGELLWHRECLPSPDENIATPLWNGEDLLFFSAAYNSGSRTLKLAKKDGKTVADELWYSRKLRIHHGNAILIGDYVYGSSGDFGASLISAVNIRTGKVAWRQRGFKKANFVYADGKLIILDEDGQLALATVSPAGLQVHSKCQVAERISWTAPTLVDTILYVRDRKNIMALDLG